VNEVSTAEVVVVEDVWGTALEDLALRRSVVRDPKAWSDSRYLADRVARAKALVVRNRTKVTAELLDAAPQLKVVARAGVGLDNIDIDAADERGVVVVAALGANATSVAEHTLALALSVARNIRGLDADTRAGGWNRSPGSELAGGTWGLLSAGMTARATARLAGYLGMEVVAYDPFVPADHPEVRELGIRLTDIEEVARQADVLSVHLPSTTDTQGIVGAELLALMKPTAILVNSGRGEVVDEKALASALKERSILGAGLDVRSQEPPAQPDPLAALDSVVLTPHIAGITHQSQARIVRMLCEDIDRVLDGADARFAVGTHYRPGAMTPGEGTSS